MGKDDGFDDPAPGEETAEVPPDEDGVVDEAEVAEASEPQRPATAAESEAAGFVASPDASTAAATASSSRQVTPVSLGPASGSADPGEREVPVDLV